MSDQSTPAVPMATRQRLLSRRQLGGLALTAAGAALLRPGAASATPSGLLRARTQGQPYASNWFPDDLVGWRPSREPDVAFMRSTVPVADRIVDAYTRANPHARPRKVLACTAFDHTDGNPAQGGPVFDYYTSEFWTYIDTLIFWGGSASEGLILAPNPTVVDAAHRNGVPVVGTLYFPPDVYGGQLQWVEDLLQRSHGHFPVAKALADIAAFYGFDGWFFNQETEGADATLAAAMVDFMTEVHERGTGVLWYDAMTESGSVGWQGALDSQNDAFFAVSDAMFVDFRWSPQTLASSAAYARGMGRRPDELFAGIDTGSLQFGGQSLMDEIFPRTGASGVSVALYRPDFTLGGAGDPSEFQERENRFWVGADDDPSSSKADDEGWRGMSTEISEHTTVTSTPFVTAFGTGHGHGWWHRGEQWQTNDWNNLSAQDVLPTWRWVVQGSRLAVGYDFTTAWQGSQSVAVTGMLGRPTDIWLYATRVAVTDTTALSVVASGAATMSAVVRFLDDPETDVVVPMGASGTEWTSLTTGPLSDFAGRILVRLGLRLAQTGAPVDLRLGWLELLDGPAALPAAPSGLTAGPSGTGYRVHWRGEPGVRYDVEVILGKGARFWLGTTTAEAFYAFDLPSGAVAVAVAVVPIAPDGRRGPQARRRL